MFLLDTSALLAHCFGEPGGEVVEEILSAGSGYVAAITWFELRVRLRDSPLASAVEEIYAASVAGTVDISRDVAETAYALRERVGVRIPAADCLIAGAARQRGYTLVHRDAHLMNIPGHQLAQRILPAKA